MSRAPGFLNKDEIWDFYLEADKKIKGLEHDLKKVTQERNDLLANLPKSKAVILPVTMLDPTAVDLTSWS